jgi:hypothetical protein
MAIRKRTILPILLLSVAPVMTAGASPDAARTPPVDDVAPRALIALRSALFEAGEKGARADMDRFRPLCDAEGYPLVGNVSGKTKGPNKEELYQPSQFCAAVRTVTRKR